MYYYPSTSHYIGGGIQRVIQLYKYIEKCDVEMYFVGVPYAIYGFFCGSPKVIPVASLLEGKGHYIRRSKLFKVVSFLYYMFVSIIGGIKATINKNINFILAPGEMFVMVLASYIIARITRRQLIIISHTLPCYGYPWGYETAFLDFSKLNDKSTKIKYLLRFLRGIGMERMRSLFYATEFAMMFKIMKRSYIITLNPLVTVVLKKMLRSGRIYEVYPGNGIEVIKNPSEEKLYDGIVAGVLSPEKGLFDAIYAWKYVTKEFPESRLAIAGWAINKQVINRAIRLINDLKLDKNIIILNNLSEGLEHLRLVNYISKSKLLIYPSKRDVWPLTVCEALGSGVPVIAYDITTFRYSFNTKGVIKVSLNSLSGIVQSICELLRNGEKYNEVSRDARNYAELFTWKNVAREEKRIYLEILKNTLAHS
jgi:glycosyltransferase involved in cell wall biosynthesis